MPMYFTKLFSGLTESTVWVEPYATRVLWVAMLSWADQHGRVYGSIPGIARRAGITREECEAALASFMSPDRYSRTPDHEGRRIEPIDGGWRLLNYARYREMRDAEARREQNREAQRRHRARVSIFADIADSQQCQQKSAQAEAEAEAEKPISTPSESIARSRRKNPRRSEPTIGEGAPVIAIPSLHGEVVICESAVREWADTYPAIDVPGTLREIRAWQLANPTRRKANVHRFVVAWLQREQDRA